VWLWWREGRAWPIGLVGAAVLVQSPDPDLPGGPLRRVYAYGGAFVVLSLLWGWAADRVAPDRYDLAGAAPYAGRRGHQRTRPARPSMPGAGDRSADHLRRPWRVHALAAAERLEVHDVWEVATALPPGVRSPGGSRPWARSRARSRAARSSRCAGDRLVLGLDAAAPGSCRSTGRPTSSSPASPTARHRVPDLLLVDRRPRLAVYVRPHGLLGRGYLRLIEPFRRWVPSRGGSWWRFWPHCEALVGQPPARGIRFTWR
jgi:hypothetical protein